MRDTQTTPAGDSPSRQAIESTVRDYVEGWYTGNVEQMDRALHDDLVKRTPGEEGGGSLRAVAKDRMLELTAEGGGAAPGTDMVIDIDDISPGIAAARVVSPDFVDYLHLVETDSGWRIANILFLYES